jgi:imidazolonepropionase-like amidohydrolase
VIGGLGAVVKTGRGRKTGDLVLADGFLQASVSRETASGNMLLRSSAPTSIFHRIPTTRMGTVFLLRRAFFEALDLARPQGLTFPEESSLARFLTPPGKVVLAETLRGRRPLHVCADDRQEIEAALRIVDEFGSKIELGTKIVIQGFAEGMDVVPEVRAKGCRVIIEPVAPEVDPRIARVSPRLAEILDRAGVEFAFGSDDGRRVPALRRSLAFSLKFGGDPERILRAATLGAARILGIEGRVGTIEPGKDADLVAVRGSGPLDAASGVEWVMVDGKIERAAERDGVR